MIRPTMAPMINRKFSQLRTTLILIQQRLELVKQEILAVNGLSAELSRTRKQSGILLVHRIFVGNPTLCYQALGITSFLIQIADVAHGHIHATILTFRLDGIAS